MNDTAFTSNTQTKNNLFNRLQKHFSKPCKIHAIKLIFLFSGINLLLFHGPLYTFVSHHTTLLSVEGVQIAGLLSIIILGITVLSLAVLSLLSYRLIKPFCILLLLVNTLALYFINHYQVILDKTMMGNLLNTRYSEAKEFIQPRLLLNLVIFWVLPSMAALKLDVTSNKRLHSTLAGISTLAVMILTAYFTSSSWLWIDQHAKQLGGRILPWSYIANSIRHQAEMRQKNQPQKPLAPLTFRQHTKMVVVLVIGETARASNFSLYGYERPTNPKLSQLNIIPLPNATSCATYTTAAVACMLNHDNQQSSVNHEPLPSYLHRHGVDVIWHSNNWGEPPIEVSTYQTAEQLRPKCHHDHCEYDEVLLSGLTDRIRSSESNQVLVVLHQKGSHGPLYHKRYPAAFEQFKPACKTVALDQCTQQELINAYDNTILYTDHFLSTVINTLKGIKGHPTMMMYVSDHGESLGEHGLYLHGTPMSLAPAEQTNIPFMLWASDDFFSKENSLNAGSITAQKASQQHVFHSILGAFDAKSTAYNPQLDLLK